MPRTIVPEEQQRVPDLSSLRSNIRPTENRTVHVDSDADGAGNIFRWDPTGDASTADGVKTIESNITEFASGGAQEGLWRRMQLPFAGANTSNLPEVGSKSGAPSASEREYFTDGRAISAIEDNTSTLQINNGGGLTDGIDMNDSVLTGLGSPDSATDATTKEYVDGLAQGLEIKDSSDVASTGDIDLTSSTDLNPIDGYTLQDGDRILLKDQADATENGIYVANTATDPTTWTRAEDFNEDRDVVSGAFTFVESGNTHGDDSFIVTTDDPITLGPDPINWSQFAAAGEIIGGDGLTKSGNTLNINVSDFAGTYLSGDGSDNLQVDIGSGLVGDGSENIEVDIGVSEGGSDFATTESVHRLDFGNNIDLTDNTGSGGGVTVDVNATEATSVDVQEGGTSVNSDVNTMNFSSNLSVVDDGGNQVTVQAPDGEIRDATFGTGGVLSGSQTLINVSYDSSNEEVTYEVNDDLSQYDNSTSDFISGVDLNDSGSSTATTIDTLNFDSNLNVSDADTSDKVATIDAVDTLISTEDGGTEVTSVTETLNFGTNLNVIDDNNNEVTIENDIRFGQETFSGDGVQTEFQIAHGLSSAPSSWTIEATTDDGSGHSHSTADSTNITVFYDTAPPSGSNNIVLNYSLEV